MEAQPVTDPERWLTGDRAAALQTVFANALGRHHYHPDTNQVCLDSDARVDVAYLASALGLTPGSENPRPTDGKGAAHNKRNCDNHHHEPLQERHTSE